MPTQLSVNINKIALLRNSRAGNFPDLVEHAKKIIAAGAHGITIHPRPDQRHIRASDAHALKDAIAVELNIEGNPFAQSLASSRTDVSDYPGFIPLVLEVKPTQCTLVPDSQTQLTSNHGFDLKCNGNKLAPIIAQLKSHGIRVSLFMEPDIEQINLAKQLGADRIELYTGPYAVASSDIQLSTQQKLFATYKQAGEHALSIGLELNAGHDLNLYNLAAFKSLFSQLHEVSIGHALIVDAIEYGLTETIRRYLHCLT